MLGSSNQILRAVPAYQTSTNTTSNMLSNRRAIIITISIHFKNGRLTRRTGARITRITTYLMSKMNIVLQQRLAQYRRITGSLTRMNISTLVSLGTRVRTRTRRGIHTGNLSKVLIHVKLINGIRISRPVYLNTLKILI